MPVLFLRSFSCLKAALLISALSLPVAPALAQEGNSGPYLAAIVAGAESDYAAAAAWYARAMLRDPTNPTLLTGAVVANLSIGEIGLAAEAGGRLIATGSKSQPATLALVTDAAKAGNYDAILTALAQGQTAGALVDQLIIAWSELGAGRMSEALAGFDRLAKTQGVEAFGLYHKALALASAGDFEGADDILSGRANGPLSVMRRGVIAHVQILSQLERNADAIALLDSTFGTSQDPQIADLKRRLAAGEPIPFDVARTASEGLAEVFFSLATALNGEAENGFTLLYTRAATHLRPDHTEAILLTAGLLELQGQFDMATAAYALIPPTDPVFHVAEIGRADATFAAGRQEASLEILQGLTRSHGHILAVQISLADGLRRAEKFDEALKVYDTAIAMIPTPDASNWGLFYARGICHERQNDFAGAEADMRKALALQPDQPQVLNYLGYSFVDRGENLDEALGMIQRAVAAEPGSGYIIDSLAWAYFRLGRYQDALQPMEQASLLEPVDPVVTDHLGDVYWSVGRTREAEFQWSRALSFKPTEKDAARIRAKLEKGLDAVLADEGAAPLKPIDAAANDN